MKTALLILLFFISFMGLSQNNYIVKTDDGRRVLLKADFTWEYIDAEVPASKGEKSTADNAIKPDSKTSKIPNCNVAQDFIEPVLDSNLQAQLKRGRATIEDIKSKVAKDNKCEVEEVFLLSASEDKSKGVYNFCVNGKMVSYKRTGYAIIKNRKLLPF